MSVICNVRVCVVYESTLFVFLELSHSEQHLYRVILKSVYTVRIRIGYMYQCACAHNNNNTSRPLELV